MTLTSTPPQHRVAPSYPFALDGAHERATAGRGLVPAPTGHVIASTTALPDAPDGPLTRFGLAVRKDAEASATPGRFAAELIDLHTALVRRTLEHAVEHLGVRTVGGTALLGRQLVQAQLADVALRLRELQVMPAERRVAGRGAPWRTHRRLVGLGRDLLRLLGASSFLVDGPGGDLHLAEVTGNLYLHPGTEHTDA